MNRKFLFVTIGVVAMLLVATFWAGNVFARTGCFSDTNGNFFEHYICWLKDNGVSTGYGDGTYRPENNITRGEMAAMLERQAEVPPSTGLILITPGNGDWVKFDATDDIFFNNASLNTQIYKATTGNTWISLQPSLPTVLYDRELQLLAVDFCYTASANVILSAVEINTFTSVTGGSNFTDYYFDDTDFTDQACHYYTLTPPVTLTPLDGAVFFISIKWNTAGITSFFELGRTTFVLQPTDTLAVASPSRTEIVMPLSETNGPPKVPGTTAP